MRTTIKNKLTIFVIIFILAINIPFTNAQASMPSGNSGQIHDGVDMSALSTMGNGIYLGTYKHAKTWNVDYWLGASTYEAVPSPILWEVMGEENSDEKIMLLSKYVLDSHVFNTNFHGNNVQDYSQSEIRTWLNGTFLNSFSVSEKSGITNNNISTGMYNKSDGTEITGLHYADNAYSASGASVTNNSTTQTISSGAWPDNTTGDKVYIPWGKYFSNTVYTSTGSDTANGILSNNTAQLKGGTSDIYWWIRSPYNVQSYDVFGIKTSTDLYNFQVNNNIGVRPVIKIDPASIIFMSKIVPSGGDGMGTINMTTDNYSPGNSGNNYKLTFVDTMSTNTLSGVPVTNQNINSGDNIVLNNLMPSQTSSDYSIRYKVVGDIGGIRKILDYGSIPAMTNSNITIDTSNLTDGNYDAYVWLEKENAIISNEASAVKHFSFNIKTMTAPDAPQNLIQIPGNEQILLTWEAPINDGGSPITGYEVSYDNGLNWLNVSLSTNYNITGLKNHQSYSLVVRAINVVGAGSNAKITSIPKKNSSSPLTIASDVGTGGNISPSGNIQVKNGDSYTFYIKADAGYSISSVLVDGTDMGSPTSYTFSNVDKNHSIFVEFIKNTSSENIRDTKDKDIEFYDIQSEIIQKTKSQEKPISTNTETNKYIINPKTGETRLGLIVMFSVIIFIAIIFTYRLYTKSFKKK